MLRSPLRIRNNLIAALDLGSTKVVCLIARIVDGVPCVIGAGMHASKGIKSGNISDLDAVKNAVLKAVHEAESAAGKTIRGVVVNLSGGALVSHTSTYEITVKGHEINDNDLHHLSYLARNSMSPAGRDGRVVLHSIPISYSLDGSRAIWDPRGMYGDRLVVRMHVISVAIGSLYTLRSCLAQCHLELYGIVASPYASGQAALTRDECDLGVTLVDLGGGTTTIAIFCDNRILYVDTIPIGGLHITNDLARGLATPIAHAERLKTLYGAAMAASTDEREVVEVLLVGEEQSRSDLVPRSILTGIIQPRMEEIFELVRGRLDASGFNSLVGGQAVLTGGGSELFAVRDLAAFMLDKQVRIGRPITLAGLPATMSGSAYSTVTGLISHALQPASHSGRFPRRSATTTFGRIGLWLKENF